MTLASIVLAGVLVVQQAGTPSKPSTDVQEAPRITISVEEYARLKTCEAQQMKRKPKSPIVVAIVAAAAVGIAAIVKRKKESP